MNLTFYDGLGDTVATVIATHGSLPFTLTPSALVSGPSFFLF